jgi:hypothetical protein
MAEYSENGLTLRWDSPDLVAGGRHSPGARVIVAASPAHPCNVVTAVYAAGPGAERIARARRFRAAAGANANKEELFACDLPPQADGVGVAFVPILTCAGRQADPRRGGFVPTPLAQPLLSSATPESTRGSSPGVGQVSPSHVARFGFEPQFLFRVTAPVDCDRDPVGETPDGLRMKFLLRSGGYVRGPAITGDIAPVGGDWMRIRPDGVGIAEIHALIKPTGGGVILTQYTGVVDFGPDGYRLLAAGGGPKRASVRFAPRYLTADPKFSWMNRLQCLGVGEVNLERYLVEYDLYAFPQTPSNDMRDIVTGLSSWRSPGAHRNALATPSWRE